MTDVIFSDTTVDNGNPNKFAQVISRDANGILTINDTLKGTTLGDPDGPIRFVPELGCNVPTYIAQRLDLVLDEKVEKRFKRLDYHVPYNMRGYFKFYDWPESFRKSLKEEFGGIIYEGDEKGYDRIGESGFVLCNGVTRSDVPARGFKSGQKCKAKAVNRSMFCSRHGGALHLADKKNSSRTMAPNQADRIARLDRVQKFMQGFLEAKDLTDEEVQGNFIYNDQGVPVRAVMLDRKFEQMITKELHVRLNSFLKENTFDMLRVMVDIAKNDLYEAGDRIKAAQWVSERTMGKQPEVIIHGTVEQPYETILDSIASGSREDYRKQISSTRVSPGSENQRALGSEPYQDIMDVETEELMEGEDEESEESFDESEEEISGNYRQGNSEHSGPLYGGTVDIDKLQSNEESISKPEGVLEKNDQHEQASFESDEDSTWEGTESGALASAREIEERKRIAAEQRKRIQKAKQRRFAARASGAKYLSGGLDGKDGTGWWLLEFSKPMANGKYKVRLWPPDQQTPEIVRRAEASAGPPAPEVLASRLDAEAAKIREKLAALENPKGN